MSHAEIVQAPAAVNDAAEAQRENSIRKRNRVLLAILLIIIAFMTLSSYSLFNNYWDPTQSDEVISH